MATVSPNWRRPRRAFLGADPYFSDTKLVLNMGLANGTNSFVNASPGGATITAMRTAVNSTEQTLFGQSTCKLTANGDYLSIADNGALGLSSLDFTVESFVYPVNAGVDPFGAERTIIGKWSATAPSAQSWLIHVTGSSLKIVGEINSDDNLFFNVPNVLTQTRWYHIAWTRLGSTMFLLVDGLLLATYNCGTAGFALGTNTWGIGGYNRGTGSTSTATFGGYIGPTRVTLNRCRYSGNYVVPGGLFPTF